MQISITAVSVALALAIGAPCAFAQSAEDTPDQYLWLEEIEGSKSLDWVRAQNKTTLAELQNDRHYAPFLKKAEALYNDKNRIPYGSLRNGYVYNFWQDGKNVRGLWRRATLPEYKKNKPAWEILLDFDKLSKKEKENWVFKGSSCLPPENRFCLLSLSRGGKDASVIREFDVEKKEFVKNGFRLEESKSGLSWLDRDTVLFADATTPDSVTKSGYARLVRKWRRGTDPKAAPVLFERDKDTMAVSGFCGIRPEGAYSGVSNAPSFFEEENWLFSGGELKKIPLPADARFYGVFKNLILASLRSDWLIGGRTFKQGSLVSFDRQAVDTGDPAGKIQTILEPGDRMTLSGITTTKDTVLVSILDNVKSRVLKFHRENGQWAGETVPVADNGTAGVTAADDFANGFMFDYANFLTPPSLYYTDGANAPQLIKQLPPKFSAKGLKVTQKEAVSKDGTKIPYFLVGPENMKYDGANPTLLYGYGGFEISMEPHYSPVLGNLWLEQGGVYALANIRGGGEFGPKWHKAALLENRQKAFDDFIAIAEDLVKTKVTSPGHLGAQGGSNGGLLMGAMFTQRPDLFKVVLCEVPLLDMLRYTKLLAGDSWKAEYGDPDEPAMRAVISRYSPYQNIRKGVAYPDIFFVTSTKDDRVHPGHARKSAAKLIALGNKVYYYENIDGGHSASANNIERAKRAALEYTLLLKEIKGR
ncbi:MAG: prolyl oligopeptidase family serine peptidase [Elusimicrobiaceae bacterium]|nr:prolyl oligopeptidase family serine peptidase [Elusimicrobiaceae bacterium]